MKNRRVVTIAILLLAVLAMQCATAADSLEGTWKGKVKATGLPFALNATAEFSGGKFSISFLGLKVAGSYQADEKTITVTISTLSGLLASQLEPPEKIGSVALPYTLDGDSLVISGSGLGIEGSITLTRK